MTLRLTHPARRGRRLGMTMLELMLAMAMVAMLAMSMYMSLRIAFKAKDSAQSAVGPVRAASIAIELLRHDIEAAMPPKGLTAGPFIGEHFMEGEGDADIASFYALADDPDMYTDAQRAGVVQAPPRGGIQQVNLEIVTLPQTNQRALVRRVVSNLLAPFQAEPEDEVLCRGVRSFSLRYYDGFTWQEYWDSTAVGDVLPMAVEVTLELAWPPDQPANAPLDNSRIYRVTRIFTPGCREDLTQQGAAL